MASVRYHFGPFVLDPGAYRLMRGETALDLAPKALEVLLRLVRQPGVLLTKDELFRTVWADVSVTDNALTQVVSDIRQALGDSASAPHYLQTVARRGYRFIGDVQPEAAADAASSAMPAGPIDGPALAVLDFDNISGDGDTAWLSAGIAETLTTDLRAFGSFRVIDRARLRDARTAGGTQLDAARRVGAARIVGGSFQRAGDRLRVSARLLDGATRELVVEVKADGWLPDVFAVQDTLTRELARSLGVTGASGPGVRRQTANLEAYRATIEGRLLLEALDPSSLPAALQTFTRAVALDPLYGAGHVGLANVRCCLFECARSQPAPPATLLLQALADARRGVELDPAFAEAHATLAFVLTSAGQREEARREALRAIALEPDGWLHHFRLANASWGAGRVAALRRVLELYPEFAFAHLQLATVHVARGALDEATRTLAEGIAVQRRHVQGSTRFPARGLHWLDGLITLAQGRPEDALTAFAAEIAADDSHLYTHELRMAARAGQGFALLALDRPDEAEAAFAVDTDDDGSGRAALGLATVAARQGRRDRGADALARIARLAQTMRSGGRIAQAHLLEAGALVVQRDDRALAQLADALSAEPGGPFAWLLRIDPVFAPLRSDPRFRDAVDLVARRAR